MNEIRHGRGYRVGLLIAAAVIVALGVMLKPHEKPNAPAPPTELETARLRRLAQERRLQELGEYISYAAQNAAKSLVYIPELAQTGVALDRHTVATALHHIARPEIIATSAARPIPLRVQERRPDVPVLFFRTAGDGNLAAPPRADVDTGDWVIAVALRADATPVFAYGLYENAAEARCGSLTYHRLRASIPLTSAFLGGGLFSLQGSLAGIIARCDSEFVVLSVPSVTSALNRPVQPNDWLQDRYGLRVAAVDAGLDVLSVWKGAAADRAGIRPGDLLVEIDGLPVQTTEQAVASLDLKGDHTVMVRRGRRKIAMKLEFPPPPSEVDVAAAGLTLADSDAGVIVRSVQKDSVAASAGLLSGDIVLRNGSTPTRSASALAAALDSTPEGVTLTVDRGGSQFEARLTP